MTDPFAQHAVRPRKKALQGRSRTTVDAILSASAHILDEGGVAAFNTNAIAMRAGVSIGSLYQYFPNKDAILVALIEQDVSALADDLEAKARAASRLSLVDDLRELLLRAVAWRERSPRLSRVLAAEEARLKADLDLTLARQRMEAVMISVLERHRGAWGMDNLPSAVRRMIRVIGAVMEAEGDEAVPDWALAAERAVGAALGSLGTSALEHSPPKWEPVWRRASALDV